MPRDTPKQLVPKFFNKTAKTYDWVVRWSTFGKDGHWKEEILKNLSKGQSFLDLACGTGILTRKIAERFPEAAIVGVDITGSYLDIAKQKSAQDPKMSFVLQDAEKLNLGKKFDVITSSYIPKYCRAEVLVNKCIQHLNPGGVLVLHDFAFPRASYIKFLWRLNFAFLGTLGWLIPGWGPVFRDLPKLIKATTWVEDYEKEMKKTGLQVRRQMLSSDSAAILTGTLK